MIGLLSIKLISHNLILTETCFLLPLRSPSQSLGPRGPGLRFRGRAALPSSADSASSGAVPLPLASSAAAASRGRFAIGLRAMGATARRRRSSMAIG